jgi:hypothetical protein
MSKNIPQIIKDVGFDFDWDEPKVWQLDVPVTIMPISELDWHFDIPFWNENGEYNLTPREVIMEPQDHDSEYKRIMRSELNFPIDIMENKGRWLILDGLHRLVKAYTLGQDMVNVRIIPRTDIPKISK